jgi:hypothetical protein
MVKNLITSMEFKKRRKCFTIIFAVASSRRLLNIDDVDPRALEIIWNFCSISLSIRTSMKMFFAYKYFSRDKIMELKWHWTFFSPVFFSIRLDSRNKTSSSRAQMNFWSLLAVTWSELKNMKKKYLFARERTAKRFSSFMISCTNS